MVRGGGPGAGGRGGLYCQAGAGQQFVLESTALLPPTMWFLIAAPLLTTALLTPSKEASRVKLTPSLVVAERYVNDTLMVRCTAPGADNITWLGPNSAPVASHTGRVHVELYQGGETAAVLQQQDSGSYQCRAFISGRPYSLSFELVVFRHIEIVAAPVQNATESKSQMVRCDVQGEPVPKVVWHYQGQPLQVGRDTRYLQLPTGLRIYNVSRSDAGLYSCRAFQITSQNSNIRVADIQLHILHRPVWRETPFSMGNTAWGYLGGMVNMSCAADANPPASFRWFRKGMQLSSTNNLSIIHEPHRSVLQFYLEGEELLGEYDCQANNSLGRIRKTLTLERGWKAAVPSVVRVLDVGAHTALLHLATPDEPHVLGFRVQFTAKTLQGYSWLSPDYQDLYPRWGDEKTQYLLADLQEKTSYALRVATRNQAGLSDFTNESHIMTRSNSVGRRCYSSLVTLVVLTALQLGRESH